VRPATIRSSREIDRIFSEGARSSSPMLLVLVSSTPDGRDRGGRVAFVAGGKLGGAVARNRAKRLLRETARRAGGPWPSWDVVLLARPEALISSLEQLVQDLLLRLRALGVLP
jgi:ribonuclease P protein component